MPKVRPATDAIAVDSAISAKKKRLEHLRLDQIPTVNDRRVRHILRLFHADLLPRYTTEQLAEKVNLSKRQLRDLFYEEFDCTPLQYYYRLRMATARELLETTFLRVKEIAAQVGASHPVTFTKYFKQAYGKTPSAYRNESPVEPLLVMAAHGR